MDALMFKGEMIRGASNVHYYFSYMYGGIDMVA